MLHIFATHHLQLVIEKKELAEVLQMELRQSSETVKEYRVKQFADYVNIISEIIRAGQANKVFRSDLLPGIVKRAFFGALDEVSRLWILNPSHTFTLEQAAETICSIFLDGITSPQTS